MVAVRHGHGGRHSLPDITTLARIEDEDRRTDAIQTVVTNITAVQNASANATDAMPMTRDSAKTSRYQ